MAEFSRNLGRCTCKIFLVTLSLIFVMTYMIMDKYSLQHYNSKGNKENSRLRSSPNNLLHTNVDTKLSAKNFTCACKQNAASLPNHLTPIDRARVKVTGIKRQSSGFLTIGIPTMKRPGGVLYIMETLDSIIQQSTPQEREEMVTVIFLSDLNTTYNDAILQKLIKKYHKYLHNGFMQIIQAPPEYNPDIAVVKRNYNDSVNRVKWRTKQVLDYAFMFDYCVNISKYYLQLEDDVLSVKNYKTLIEKFIIKNSVGNKIWAVLGVDDGGFRGKLMKSADLPKMASYMRTFSDEQPVDWLVSFFRMSMGQKDHIGHKPSLFHHVGKASTFTENGNRRILPISQRFKSDSDVKKN